MHHGIKAPGQMGSTLLGYFYLEESTKQNRTNPFYTVRQTQINWNAEGKIPVFPR